MKLNLTLDHLTSTEITEPDGGETYVPCKNLTKRMIDKLYGNCH